MHIGNLRTALYGYLYAMKEGGDFILRLEDTDSKRYVDGAVQIIYDTLKDAGIRYAEGPDVGGDFGPYIQSERGAIYHAYAEKLVELGGAYYCFCDKERIDSLKDENGIGRYDKHCLHLSKEEIRGKLAAGVPYVIRQNIPESGTGSYTDLVYGEVSVDFKDIEDGVLLKSDGMPTYNFANVVDDHLMGITHVIRGSEYLSSTPKYNLMYDAFGWERPAYIHLPPIMKNSHEKLSKRNGDASYQDLVDKGYVKEAIVNYIALLGWSPKSNVEKMTLRELEENFSLAGINKSPSIFDEPKLRWLSGEYIKAMTDEEFLSLSEPFLQKSKAYGKYDSLKLAHILKTRTEVMSDIPSKIDFIEEFGPFDSALYFNKKMKSDENIAREVLPDALEKLSSLETFENAAIYAALCDLAAARGMKNGQVLWCVRVALTGRENTPGGASEMAEILGKERSLERISKALGFLGGK
jgi:glutamate--tRNA ligase